MHIAIIAAQGRMESTGNIAAAPSHFHPAKKVMMLNAATTSSRPLRPPK
jgi:hypothetical protein